MERQKAEIIDHWLRNSRTPISWVRLAEAVRRLGGHDQLVSNLENNYPESNRPGASGIYFITLSGIAVK